MIRKIAVAIGSVALVATAFAHHSFAIYDIDNKIERTGVLTKMEYRNPHIQFVVEVTKKDGTKEIWDIESMNTGRWDSNVKKRDVAKIGETVTVLGWPARDGSDHMVLSAIISPSGGTTLVVERIRQAGANAGNTAEAKSTTVKRETKL